MEKPILFSTDMVQALLDGRKTQTRRTVKIFSSDENELRQNAKWLFENKTCPYGNPGDLLWVREACAYVMIEHAPDLLEGSKDSNQWVYKASMHADFMEYAKETYGYKWKPSIHMPKDAARIWLKVTNVRVERLQDITNEDAISEGILKNQNLYYNYTEGIYNYRHPYSSFISLWLSINGKGSALKNPWVWVVEFEVVSTTGIAKLKED